MLDISNVIIVQMSAGQWILHILSHAVVVVLSGLLNFGLLRKYANSPSRSAIIKTVVIVAVQTVLLVPCYGFLIVLVMETDLPFLILVFGVLFAFIVISSTITFFLFVPTKMEGVKDRIRGDVLALVSALAYAGIHFALRVLPNMFL